MSRNLFENSLKEKFTTSEMEYFWKELHQYNTLERLSIESVLTRLLANEPIQYINKACYFYDFELYIDENCLIPRPETEELILEIINKYKGTKPTILDIGTGSGCIAIGLAKHLQGSTVHAMDYEEGILAVAKRNANALGLDIAFFCNDVLNLTDLAQRYDVIVSNPPYILPSEKVVMSESVLTYEPFAALYTPEKEPFLFYLKIAELAEKHLFPGGSLYFECNEFNAKDLAVEMEKLQFEQIQLIKDMQGKDRILHCIASPL